MKNPNTTVQGALIIHGLIPKEDLWKGLQELLDEIENLPQPIPWGYSKGGLYITVHRKNKSGDIHPPIEWATSALSRRTSCAAIAIKYNSPWDDLDPELSSGFAECQFQDLARTFSFAANISRPGCLEIMSVAWRCTDDSCEEKPGLTQCFAGAVEYSLKTGWPPLKPVPFGSVYAWIIGNLLHLRSGDTAVSRAFNAYTWLFGESGQDFPFRLVSALIGIEALFARTTSGVADQVRRRAELLLGQRTSFKKDLDKMYAARSAFLHGSTQFPPHGLSWDTPGAIEQKMDKIHGAEDIAIAVLVSSLQKLASQGWNTLEFSEGMTGSGEAKQPGDEVIGSTIPYAETSALDKWMTPFIRRFD
jgi:hypothetical protein